MASKRLREENDEDLANKKPKTSIPVDILSLLDDEEVNDESTEDLSSLIKTLEQELSTAEMAESDADGASRSSSSSTDEEERERVMRHLLEASDDELGLPVIETSGSGGVSICSGGFVSGGSGEVEGFDVCDGVLWQLEDEAANYYDLMQFGIELFMP